jgi:thymidylate synthase
MEVQEILADTKINHSWFTKTLNYVTKQSLQKIENGGYESAPRGLKVREMELAHLEIDPRFSVPDFDSREFNWKYFMGELSWYMSRDCGIDWINNFSSFWKNISDNGFANSNYGHILFGRQLQWAKDSLIKDPNTRQAISFVNQPKYQYEGNKDFVCTMYINFWIRNNRLNMKVQMRSNDIFYGLTYDAPFFATLMQTMWYWLKEKYPSLELGTYHHLADNLHYYERHFELAKDIQSEGVKTPIFFLLREPLFTMVSENYIITDAGRNFLTDVAAVVNGEEPITQEVSHEILSKYFYIQ